MRDQDSGGAPHLTVGQPPAPDARVTQMWVLVAITPEGGEGVYGQRIGEHMHNFVAESPEIKDMLEDFLRSRGSIEAARRSGVTLEWRRFGPAGGNEAIT